MTILQDETLDPTWGKHSLMKKEKKWRRKLALEQPTVKHKILYAIMKKTLTELKLHVHSTVRGSGKIVIVSLHAINNQFLNIEINLIRGN